MLLRLLARFSALAGAASIGAALVASPAADRSRLRVDVKGGEHAWATALSLATDDPREVAAVSAGSATFSTPRLPLVVCAGAENVATECRHLIPRLDDTISFSLSSGRRIRARFFIGRAPAPRATVYLRVPVEGRQAALVPLRRENGDLVMSARLDAAATLALDHVAPGAYVLETHFPGGRIHEHDVVIPPPRHDGEGRVIDEVVQLADIRIDEGVAVNVIVSDSDGKPIEGAGVGITQRPADEAEGKWSVFETHSDADGRAKLTGLDASLPGELACTASGFARVQTKLDVLPPDSVCTMERLGGIKGIVRDSDARPIRDAVVSVSPSGRRATTDSAGRYQIANVRAGAYDLRVSAAGFRRASRDITVASGMTAEMDAVELERGESFTGHVLDDEDGKPVARAIVTVVDPPGGASTTSGDDGSFSLAGDPSSDQSIEASANGYARHVVSRKSGATGETLVRLYRAGALQVKVWSDAGDSVCVGCRVVIAQSATVLGALTRGDGIARFDELAPGTYEVTRERSTAGAAVLRVSGSGGVMADVRPRETTTVELGTPAGELRVRFSPASPAGWQLSYRSTSINGTVSADLTGVYAIRKRDGEVVTLSLVQNTRGVRVATVPATFDGASFDTRLPSGVVAATLQRADHAAAGVFVELASAGGLAAWGWTDANGSIAFPYLSDDAYTLTVAKQPIGNVARVLSGVAVNLGAINVP